MENVFQVDLALVQPSQLYISSEKLARVMATFDPEDPETLAPIPVKELGGQLVFMDGHTRALAAHLAGYISVPAYRETDELNWVAYEICVDWCIKEGIFTIADLAKRVVSPIDYQTRWLDRCREMHKRLGIFKERDQVD